MSKFNLPSVRGTGYTVPVQSKDQKWAWGQRQVIRLYHKGIFYQKNQQEYAFIIQEIANPYYWPVTASNQNHFSRARRQVLAWFNQAVCPKKRAVRS